MDSKKILNTKRLRRKIRIRSRILGTASRPRLSVFRSNRYTSIQLIDDEKGKTLLSISTREIAKEKKEKGGIKPSEVLSDALQGKVKQAEKLGELLAQKASEKKIKQAVFDRGNYKYHGRVKMVAEAARKSGLKI